MSKDIPVMRADSNLLETEKRSMSRSYCEVESRSNNYHSVQDLAGKMEQRSREAAENYKQNSTPRLDSNCVTNMNQSSSSVYWDSQNVNFSGAIKDPCLEVRSEDILRTTSFKDSDHTNINHHISLETMIKKFEQDNARLNEKVERLALKEETSSFLNLSESQKLRQDVGRIEEINLRLRRCLAERLTKERELQEKIEQLRSDLCIRSAHSINPNVTEPLKSHLLRHQEMIEFLVRSNCFDAMQHKDEHWNLLEKKIDQLAENVSAVKRREKELMEKSQKDDLTIKQLCQRVDAMKCGCKTSTSDECENPSKTVDSGTKKWPSIENENSTLDLKNNNESNNISSTFLPASANSVKSDGILQNEVDKSSIIIKLKLQEENPSHDSKLTLIDHKENRLTDKIDTCCNSSNYCPEFSVPSMADQTSIAQSKEISSGGGKISLQDFKPSVQEYFPGEMVLERSCVAKECLESSATTGIQIRNLVEFFEMDTQKSLRSNNSDCNLSHNVTSHTFRPPTSKDKLPDCQESQYQFYNDDDHYADQVCVKKSVKSVIKGAESNAETDQKCERKLSVLEKFIQKLGEQLQFVERKLADVEPNNPENRSIDRNHLNQSNHGFYKSDLLLKDNQAHFFNDGETVSQKEQFILNIESDEEPVQKWRLLKLNIDGENHFQARDVSNVTGHFPSISSESVRELNEKELSPESNKKEDEWKQVDKKTCSSIPESKKFFCLDNNIKMITEINVSSSMPTQMNVKFVKSAATGYPSKEESSVNTHLPDTVDLQIQKEGKSKEISTEPRKCLLTKPEKFLKDRQIHSNIEKYIAHLGKRCLFLETTLKEQEQQYDLLCSALNSERNEDVIKETSALRYPKSHKIEVTEIVHPYPQSEQSKGSNNLKPQNAKKSVSNGELQESLTEDHQNCELLEKYVSKLNTYMKDIEKCLSLQKKMQLHFLNIIQESPVIRATNLATAESLQTVLNPPSPLKETQSHFNENFSRSPSEDEYFMVKACSSKELLIDQKSSSNILHCGAKNSNHHQLLKTDICSKDVKENFTALSPPHEKISHHESFKTDIHSKDVKENFIDLSALHEKISYQESLKTDIHSEDVKENFTALTAPEKLISKGIQFKVIEGQCSKLENHLKIIEANLKYQDAIYHYLETCIQKKKLETNLAKTSFIDQVSSLTFSHQKSREQNSKGRRKISKIRRERKPISAQDKKVVQPNTDETHNLQSEDARLLKGSARKFFKTSKIDVLGDKNLTKDSNRVEAELRENVEEKQNQMNLDLNKHLELHSTCVPAGEATSEKKLNSERKCFDLKSDVFPHSSNPTSFFDSEKGRSFTSKIPLEVIHRKIKRIGKSTALLEEKLNNHCINREEKNEICCRLKKLFKEKELVSKCLIKNRVSDGQVEEK